VAKCLVNNLPLFAGCSAVPCPAFQFRLEVVIEIICAGDSPCSRSVIGRQARALTRGRLPPHTVRRRIRPGMGQPGGPGKNARPRQALGQGWRLFDHFFPPLLIMGATTDSHEAGRGSSSVALDRHQVGRLPSIFQLPSIMHIAFAHHWATSTTVPLVRLET